MIGLFVLALIVVGGLTWSGWYFGPRQRLRRLLAAAPRRRIAEAVDGASVRLDGVVQPGATVIAPLTGRPCVCYEAVIDEWVSSGKSGRWRNRVRELQGVVFAIDDGTGRALIDPTRAAVDVELDRTTQSGTFDDPTPIEQAFLARHGLAATTWGFNKRLRYREGAIEIGETIAASGVALREPDPDAVGRITGYRDGPPTRVRLGASREHPIRLSDAPAVTR